MSPRLVSPEAAGQALVRALERTWAESICAELDGQEPQEVSCGLSPGVTSGRAVERLGTDLWHRWRRQWRELPDVPGVWIELRTLSLQDVNVAIPARLRANGPDAAIAIATHLGDRPPKLDLDRARKLAFRLRQVGGTVSPSILRALCRMSDVQAGVVLEAVEWLREHPDLSNWTTRQLPVPTMHSKWLAKHTGLLHAIVGRDIRAETRPRLAVVHVTYVDPTYLAGGGRHHDAWTTGDRHQLAYQPQTVLVVENRDCRLWFPPVEKTVVVEGGGKAAASLLAGVSWIRRAERVVYWGDIDADGYAILDRLRASLAQAGADGSGREDRFEGQEVVSILMDGTDLDRYAGLGVSVDAAGREIKPCGARLTHLTEGEAVGYAAVATAGPAAVRRIEQERIPVEDAVAALGQVGNK